MDIAGNLTPNDEIYIIWLKIPVMTCCGLYPGPTIHLKPLKDKVKDFVTLEEFLE